MSIESVDLNLLVVLHHVLAEGSVTRAAQRLHVTPPAVSNSLARLRDILGDPLLVRHGRTLIPTPRARELAPQVAAVVDAAKAVLTLNEPFRPEECTRSFTIATADHIAVIPPIVQRFTRLLPRAALRVVTLDHAIATDGLASGDTDILIGLPPAIPRQHRSAPAYTERLVCALHPEHPAARRRLTLNLFLASRHIEVAFSGQYAIDFVDTVLAGLGHSRTIGLSVPQFTMAATCAAADASYITMLPERMARQLASVLPLVIRDPPFELPSITILQVWHQRTDTDPASTLLRTIIREAARLSVHATPPHRAASQR